MLFSIICWAKQKTFKSSVLIPRFKMEEQAMPLKGSLCSRTVKAGEWVVVCGDCKKSISWSCMKLILPYLWKSKHIFGYNEMCRKFISHKYMTIGFLNLWLVIYQGTLMTDPTIFVHDESFLFKSLSLSLFHCNILSLRYTFYHDQIWEIAVMSVFFQVFAQLL